MGRFFIKLFAMPILLCFAKDSCDPVATVGNSKIIGTVVRVNNIKVHQYLGIPYGRPPVNELRFQKTQPFGDMPPVFRATDPPPMCPQYTKKPHPAYNSTARQSEDCLFLNVWTSETARRGKAKAVMYWIYGGQFIFASISNAIYSGVALAALGDIIVVTVNYRGGPFGFLSFGTKDTPGNAGLWDILEGLRWVNKNIAAFGGDPQQVTVAGQSVGAIAVGLISISPLAKGLFTRHIMMSESPVSVGPNNNAMNMNFSQALAEAVGCSSGVSTVYKNARKVVKCLRDLDAFELCKAFDDLPGQKYLFPTFGDALMPEVPSLTVARGGFDCTPLLAGNTADEGSTKIIASNSELFGQFGEGKSVINKSDAQSMIRTFFRTFMGTDAPEHVVQYYLPQSVRETDFSFTRKQVVRFLGDLNMYCPLMYYVDKCAEKGSDIFLYLWDHRPSNTPYAKWMGVTHFSEVPFVFGQPFQSADYPLNEKIISLELIKIWSNFVKTGYPLLCWSPFSSEEPNLRSIPDLKYLSYYRKNCDYLRPVFGF